MCQGSDSYEYAAPLIYGLSAAGQLAITSPFGPGGASEATLICVAAGGAAAGTLLLTDSAGLLAATLGYPADGGIRGAYIAYLASAAVTPAAAWLATPSGKLYLSASAAALVTVQWRRRAMLAKEFPPQLVSADVEDETRVHRARELQIRDLVAGGR